MGLVYLSHPFPGFEWDVSQACLPLLPCYPTFLEVLSGVYAGITDMMQRDAEIYNIELKKYFCDQEGSLGYLSSLCFSNMIMGVWSAAAPDFDRFIGF